MDPDTAIAIGQVASQVLSCIFKYYSDVKDAKSEIIALVAELQGLQSVVIQVERASIPAGLQHSLDQSLIDITKLEKKLDPGTADKIIKRFGKRALEWLFSKGEIDRRIAALQRFKGTINLALMTDQASRMHDIDINVNHLKDGQDSSKQDDHLRRLPVAFSAIFDSYHQQHESVC